MPKTDDPDRERRPLPRPFSSWWGAGEILEETFLPAPDPVAEPCFQLVRFEDGRKGLRFSHYHGRRWGRDPLVIADDDLADLRRALEETPGIRRFLERLLRTRPAERPRRR